MKCLTDILSRRNDESIEGHLSAAGSFGGRFDDAGLLADLP